MPSEKPQAMAMRQSPDGSVVSGTRCATTRAQRTTGRLSRAHASAVGAGEEEAAWSGSSARSYEAQPDRYL